MKLPDFPQEGGCLCGAVRRAWRDPLEHAEVRRRAREGLYQDFTIYICDEPHDVAFSRAEP